MIRWSAIRRAASKPLHRAAGLSVRLTVSYLAVALIVLGSAGVASYSVLARHVWQVEEQSVAARGQAAQLLAAELWQRDPDMSAADLAKEVQSAIPGVWAVPLGPGFKPTSPPPAGVKLTSQEYLASRPTVVVRTDGHVVIVVPTGDGGSQFVQGRVITPAPDPVDALHVRITPYTTPGSGRVALVAQTFLEAGALALVVALLMAFWLSRQLTAPLRRLTAATGRLAAGEWETPLPTTDLTEVNALSESLQTMAGHLKTEFQRLQGDREELKRLTAETAHEIKTPIASLRTYFELLLDGEQENPASRPQLLQRGLAQVERLQYLADFLVDMARLQAHAATLDMEEVDLADLVRQEAEAWRVASPDSAVRLVSRIPAGPIPMVVSRHRIGQALGNLVGNARQWSPAGGAVTVTVLEEAQAVRIAVSDEGPGIPREMQQRLFEPFVRGEGSKGLGLGLAVVQAVAASHGGRVEVESEPGRGTCFTLVLPRPAQIGA